MVLQIIAVAMGLVALFVVARRWANTQPPKPEPLGPHAMFDGGDHYATAEEQMRIETDGPSGAGEGVLMALVAALRARGVGTNPVEPESYGFMTVVEIDGEDVILELGAGGEQAWLLFVKAPSGKVPLQIMDALRSLEGVRNVTWSV